MDPSTIQAIAYNALPLVLAITLHEAAHGFAAAKLGDTTALVLGRVTANPVPHIDPVGTLLIPVALLLMGAGFLFGWAKPVPVVQRNLRRPRRDMGLVAFAGPAANFAMAFGWALMYKLLPSAATMSDLSFFHLMAIAGVKWNVILAVLNLLPVPPLDGGRILVSVLPPNLASQVARYSPYVLIALLVWLFTGGLGQFLFPVLEAVYNFFFQLVGV